MNIYKIETITSVENTHVLFVNGADIYSDLEQYLRPDSLSAPIITRVLSKKIKKITPINNLGLNQLLDDANQEFPVQFAESDEDHVSRNVMRSIGTSLIMGKPLVN